jgi:predicted thioredoxin/glutaredoxin
MKTIQVITFKGCQSTIDFLNTLENSRLIKKIKYHIKMTVVPSENISRKAGLYGSPTILINGREYQKERRGPPGFY